MKYVIQIIFIIAFFVNIGSLFSQTQFLISDEPNSIWSDSSTVDSQNIELTNNSSILKLTSDSTESNNVLTIGGAIRLNYSWQDYNDQRKDKIGEFGFELFRIDVNGNYDNLFLSVQYRWYADFEAIHHAYFGYRYSPEFESQIGIHQIPFGILPYAAHSFWFDATYYLGFEDDYDTGIKFIYKPGNWNFQAAFYKNTEYIDASRAGRYSFDLVTTDDQKNEEINQFNLRVANKLNPITDLTIDLGVSAEVGQIYNQTTREKGSRFAYALHSDLFYKSWNLQTQWINYSFEPQNPVGVDSKTVQLGAFLYPFFIAAKGDVINLNIAKNFSMNWFLIDNSKFYVDFSKVFTDKVYGHNSTQIVIGSLLVKKGLYTYIDYIIGQNMWFSGGPGVGLEHPDSKEWFSRLNINFGFYF